MKIDEILNENNNIDLKVKILSVDKREVTTSKGNTIYHYGLVGDETGVLSYTAWEFPAPIKTGDVVEIKYARSKEYNGRIRLYFDSKTEIILKPGESMDVKNTYREKKLQDISLKEPFVSVTGKVTGMAKKEYNKDGRLLVIYNGFIEDDTSRVRLSSFGKELENGKIYKIKGAKVSEFNKQMELSIGDKTEVFLVNDENINFERNYKIAEITNPAGSINIMGFIITLGTKSGIIKKCSDCNKPLTTGVCPDHPDAKTILDIFSYFTVDDGTKYLQCIAGKNAILPFLNIKNDEIAKYAGDIYTKLNDNLYGHAVKMNVDFIKNDNELSARVNTINNITEADIKNDIILNNSGD